MKGLLLSQNTNTLVSQNCFELLQIAVECTYNTGERFINNVFQNLIQIGIKISMTAQYSFEISENTFQSIPTALDFSGMYFGVIENNWFTGCNRPIVLSSSVNNTVVNNRFLSGYSNAITLSSAFNNTIFNNTITSPNSDGIIIISGSKNCLINNTIYGGLAMGIKLQSSIDNWLINNTIYDMTSYPIYLSGSNGNWVIQNYIHHNAVDGIYLTNSHFAEIRENIIQFQANIGIRSVSSDYAKIFSNFISNITYKSISLGGIGNEIYLNFVDYQSDIVSTTAENIISMNYYLLEDTDNDGLIGIIEYQIGTNPNLVDSDNDNFLDGYEYSVGTDPNDPFDTPILPQVQYNMILDMLAGNMTLINIIFGFLQGNWSYLQSMQETLLSNISSIESVLYQLDGVLGDIDCDGLPDIYEIGNGTNPLSIDTDLDGLGDAFELKIGTNPLADDSDGDGYLDGEEYFAGTDPLDPNDFPNKPIESQNATFSTGAFIGVLFGGLAIGGIGVFVLNKKKLL
jgi:parallel beta-helix repeat protein